MPALQVEYSLALNAFDLELIPVSKKVIENLVIYNDEIRTRFLNCHCAAVGITINGDINNAATRTKKSKFPKQN